MKTTRPIAGILLALLTATVRAADTNLPALVPLPQKMALLPGRFQFQQSTEIEMDPMAASAGRYLSDQLRKSTGFRNGRFVNDPEHPRVRSANATPHNSIFLTTNAFGSQTNQAVSDLGAEGYELEVWPNVVHIRASAPGGFFYGVQTLLQLLPPDVFSPTVVSNVSWSIPCVKIEDQPRFKWRGWMLDVSRHFFTKPEVEQMLDAMAMQKLNVFHWHLTDDQAWRIEIKKYPRLTEIGAWRKESGFNLDPKASTAYGKDGRYGGFYTQNDIREVVKYAADRNITIVPEIETPGHATAALMAYPQYSCTGGPFTTDLPGGVFNGIYCVGNDASFTFVEDILSEVFALFPGKYIHIGGDEVTTNNWHDCPKCQARMKKEGLKNDVELESYFVRRLEKFINAHGKTLIGWSEIRDGGLAQNAVVMDWVGGAVEAASAGHDVVMSPLEECYLDHYQSKDTNAEPYAIGGYLPLGNIYAYEPVPANLPPQFAQHILGAQGNEWTEYMPNLKHVQYMAYPRLCALAEVDWSPKDSRDWDDFVRRMAVHFERLRSRGINFRNNLTKGG